MRFRSKTGYVHTVLAAGFVLAFHAPSFAQCSDAVCTTGGGGFSCENVVGSGKHCSATDTKCEEIVCAAPGVACSSAPSLVTARLLRSVTPRDGPMFSFVKQERGAATIVAARFSNGQALSAGIISIAEGEAVLAYRLGWVTIDSSGSARYQLGPWADATELPNTSGRAISLESPGVTTDLLLRSTQLRAVLFFVHSVTRADGSTWTADVPALIRNIKAGNGLLTLVPITLLPL